MIKARQNFDDVAWDRNDEAWEESQKRLRLKSTCRLVEALAERVFKRKASLVPPIIFGGFNVLYRLRLEETSSDVVVRLPCPDLIQFPQEKTLYEATTARYIANNTKIPAPTVFHHASSSEVGPAAIFQYVESTRDMSDALAIPGQPLEDTPVLNPNINEGTLKTLYEKIAALLLQLSKHAFPRIGSLVDDDYSVAGRPITQNMNNMIQLANIPRSILPPGNKTYESADEWYSALAEMHVAQLLFQHNDLIRSEDDCRNKYIARYLFYSLARQGRLSSFGFLEDDWSAQSKSLQSTCPTPSRSNSFRLWCDDLRPVNILLNKDNNIVAVIDWEFAYAAPTQFSLDPPWWLLLEVPEMWSSGIEDWASTYDMRLKTWIQAMEDAESAETDSFPFKLSAYMRESWTSGRFWLNYAARKSWAFDTIFWKYLDERFFGLREGDVPEHELWKARVDLLGEEGRRAMEEFVQRKMEESKERILVDWDPEEAKTLLSEMTEQWQRLDFRGNIEAAALSEV